MRILIFSEYFPSDEKFTGGVEARCYYLSKNLSKKNDVYIISSWREGLKKEEHNNNLHIFRVGNHKYSNNLGFFSRISFAFVAYKFGINLSKKIKFDIIDGQNFTTYMPAYYLGKKLKIPVIATYHETWIGKWIKNKGFLAFPYEIYERFLLKLNYDYIISVSNFTKKQLIKNGIKENKIFVIPNGINFDEFQKIKEYEDKIKKEDYILFIGRLVKTKNVDMLINAAKLLNIKCKIIGTGPELNNLKKISNENIEFLGNVERKELLYILKASKIFCLPSSVEGFGIVVLEAMASGVPYICKDIEVLREITENGKGGLFFNNFSDLIEKIKLLFNDEKLYIQKSKEGIEVAKKYDWKNISEITEKLYRRVLK